MQKGVRDADGGSFALSLLEQPWLRVIFLCSVIALVQTEFGSRASLKKSFGANRKTLSGIALRM